MSGIDPNDLKAAQELLFPYAEAKGRRLRKRGLKFAHYTTADTAVKIIRGKDVWLRNVSNMNDYMEVQHGSACLGKALQAHGPLFMEALAPLGDGLAESILQSLDAMDFNARFHTYLISLSEHPADDKVGKLSMWRAYGGANRGRGDGVQSPLHRLRNERLGRMVQPSSLRGRCAVLD